MYDGVRRIQNYRYQFFKSEQKESLFVYYWVKEPCD
jgi:hypothetical protein